MRDLPLGPPTHPSFHTPSPTPPKPNLPPPPLSFSAPYLLPPATPAQSARCSSSNLLPITIHNDLCPRAEETKTHARRRSTRAHARRRSTRAARPGENHLTRIGGVLHASSPAGVTRTTARGRSGAQQGRSKEADEALVAGAIAQHGGTLKVKSWRWGRLVHCRMAPRCWRRAVDWIARRPQELHPCRPRLARDTWRGRLPGPDRPACQPGVPPGYGPGSRRILKTGINAGRSWLRTSAATASCCRVLEKTS